MDNPRELNKNNAVYVELDAILDTRLGLLFNINPDLVKVALSNNYKDRTEDYFIGIGKEDFAEKYSKRDKQVLINSTVTGIFGILNSIITEIIKNSITTPVDCNPVLYLNIYPYVLDTDEQDIIISAIVAITRKLITVEVVNMTPTEVTPGFLKERVTVAIMYEHHKWLLANMETLKTDPSPGLALVGPMLYFGDKPDKAKLVEIEKEYGGVFKAIEEMSSPIIGLQLLPVSCFSIEY